MQNVSGDDCIVQSDDRQDAHLSIVSDLLSLIGHIQTSQELIELAIVREASLDDLDACTGVTVLDDVTPRYLAAAAALKACRMDLGVALDLLLDSGGPRSLN
jgi:hypothetical protein